MGVEQERLRGAAHGAEVFVAALQGQVGGVVEPLDRIALRLGAVQRMGGVDLRCPDVHNGQGL